MKSVRWVNSLRGISSVYRPLVQKVYAAKGKELTTRFIVP